MLVGGITYVVMKRPFADDYELVDQLGGNLFPSAILSVATTNTQVIPPMSGEYVGNPKSCVAIKLKSGHANTVVRIELAETPFYARSVSTFVLPKEHTEYIIYPDILWRYNALRDNEQAEPISVVANVEVDGKDLGQKVRTFSVRSINECLLGFNKQLPDGRTRYVSTRLFYAAYVNEENPLIDKVLREALNTRIVRRFLGYQSTPEMVDKQVYALWYVLQKRNFRYSSVSYSSLSSNVVYAQRVRTFEDALNSSQINCVDGSVLFASLLRAINITPVLVQMPGHMFVGYYTDSAKKNLTFLETTMIGDVDLDDYFPDEKLDSTRTTKSQGEMSRLTFEKSKEYALREYMRVKDKVQANKPNYLFVEINKNVRRNVQSIGK
ncbi:MAG: hypothetical protein ACM674_01290 [Bacteroidales bacterium]|uniref:hypothetical protein n=1 Tax=Prevotellamassilia timonensis TaxID=1852370 RepID=UPI003A8FEAAE